MDNITLSLADLAALSGQKKDVLLESFKDEEGNEIQDLVKIGEISKNFLIEKIQNHGADQFKRADKKRKLEIEAIIKGHGINEFENYEDAITKLVEASKATASGGKAKLDDLTKEELMKHPAFKDAISGEILDLQADRDKYKNNFNQVDSDFTNFKNLQGIKSVANTALLKMKASFGEDKAKRLDFFYRGIDLSEIKLVSGIPVVVDSDGEQLLDNLKNPVTFDAWLKDKWVFGFETVKGQSPNHSQGQGSGSNIVVTSEQQFNELLDKASTAKERAVIYAAYSKYNKK